MKESVSAKALDHLLTALEYGTAKEDREFTEKLLEEFHLQRLPKDQLVEKIHGKPGFEPFFLAAVRESRPFALMLKEVYELLSRFGTTAERRAAIFRVSGEGARATFDFDLEAFSKDVMRWIGEVASVVSVFELRFAKGEDSAEPITWSNSSTKKMWDAISPFWDGDFYDDGFHRAASYAGTIFPRATPAVKARIQTLMEPIIDRLRALTAAIAWSELGIEQRMINQVSVSYINDRSETLQLLRYPEVNSRLDRNQAIAFLSRDLSEDDSLGAAVLSGPIDTIIWHKLDRSVLSMAITINMWVKLIPRSDHRNWLESKLWKPLDKITGEDYLAFLEPLAENYQQSLDSVMSLVEQEPTVRLQEALIEFFRLPFWRDRWFLYELWTLCRVLTIAGSKWPMSLQGIERRDDTIEWKLPGGLAKLPVARIGANGEIECWTQRKTVHPVTKAGLEPDLRITRSTEEHPDVYILENKDRRKPRKSDMAEIVERYVTGSAARCVCMVNYEEFTGPTASLSKTIPSRDVQILSRFRPPEVAPEFKLRLLQILSEELDTNPPAASAAVKPKVAESIEVTLEWTSAPDDLDLHVWVERKDGVFHVDYLTPGAMDAPPFAQLGGDALSPGRETVILRTADLKGAVIAVHRFSAGRLDDSQPRIRVTGIQDGPCDIALPSKSKGAWWHVARIGGDGSLDVMSVIADHPPIDKP